MFRNSWWEEDNNPLLRQVGWVTCLSFHSDTQWGFPPLHPDASQHLQQHPDYMEGILWKSLFKFSSWTSVLRDLSKSNKQEGKSLQRLLTFPSARRNERLGVSYTQERQIYLLDNVIIKCCRPLLSACGSRGGLGPRPHPALSAPAISCPPIYSDHSF